MATKTKTKPKARARIAPAAEAAPHDKGYPSPSLQRDGYEVRSDGSILWIPDRGEDEPRQKIAKMD